MVETKLGAWELKGSKPKLYTNKAADIIKCKSTGKEYRRGIYVLNRMQEPPNAPRVEDSKDYEFIYIGGNGPTTITHADEVLAHLWLNSKK